MDIKAKRILSILVILSVVFPTMAPVGSATMCNILPPWGVCLGLGDIFSCFSIASILSFFNFFNLFNLLGIVFNGCSLINYSVECGWNFLSYCIWPCTLVNCGNVINLFSGRVTIFNIINIMSGIFNFGNIFNLLSGSCVNLMNGITIGGGLYPPFINTGGCLNVLTGCNPCNPCLPICVNTGLTDFMNVLFLPITIIIGIITALLTPLATLWGTALSPLLFNMTYQEMCSSLIGVMKDPLPACGSMVTKLLTAFKIKDMCGLGINACKGLLVWLFNAVLGTCLKTGLFDSFNIIDMLSGLMEKFLPMRMSLEGK